jgi:predicted benzoate:H+ symporter BenE
MMGNYHGFMGIYGASAMFLAVISIIGLISGVIMVIGAAMLKAHPQEHAMWGTVMIVFSAISFVGMGGFFIGALLGIIGGACAISYRPRAARM